MNVNGAGYVLHGFRYITYERYIMLTCISLCKMRLNWNGGRWFCDIEESIYC